MNGPASTEKRFDGGEFLGAIDPKFDADVMTADDRSSRHTVASAVPGRAGQNRENNPMQSKSQPRIAALSLRCAGGRRRKIPQPNG
jgi:hypothetical protein